MRVDFYQLGRDPVEVALPLIARAATGQGERMLVVSEDAAQLHRIGAALWERFPETFLANGRAGQPNEARQPILLSDRSEPSNGARFLALADGKWREGEGFERVFYLFDEATLAGARAAWVALKNREGLTRHFWKQEGGRWIEAG